MCDHATMNDMVNAWGLHAITALNQHIAEAVSGLLPEGVEILAVNLQLVLEKTRPGGAPRAVSSFSVSPPADFDTTPFDTVARGVLADLQDEVALYLHQPWPVADGASLHGWADQVGDEIRLSFRGEGANADAAAITLPPFPLPPGPEQVVVAG
jgi:hypothetical protein